MEKGTKCLLVQSEFSAFSFWNYVDICDLVGAKYPAAPLGLITVAALLPQQWEFKLVDANAELLKDEYFEWADIVCTGGMLPQQKGMFSVIDKAHQYGCPVVLGGPDPTSQPNLYQSADYLVLGEGEITIPMFIQDLERSCKSGEYKSDEKADMTKAVVPRFDLVRFRDYIQVGIQYSRGCPFNCEFCDIIELYGRQPRTKNPEQIIKELQALYNLGYRGHIDFVDDNFIGNKKNIKKVLYSIKEWSEVNHYPFYYSTESSLNLADDDSLLRMMKAVDFRYVFIGIESPEDEVLKFTNKRINMKKPVVKAVKKIYSYGMIVNAGFIIGFDNETDQTAENMIKCIHDSGICMAMLGMLYALPKTQLSRRLKREGRLIEDGSTLRYIDTEIDQMTTGLNFVTTRSRLEVLKDYIEVIRYIYDPAHYFTRVTYTGLNLRPNNKNKPSVGTISLKARAFLKLCLMIGFTRTTGRLYWKTLITVAFKNIKAVEAAVNLSAMFIHFTKMSKFIIDYANKEIRSIESIGDERHYQKMLQEDRNAYTHKESGESLTNI